MGLHKENSIMLIHTQLLYHIAFATKNRQRVFNCENCKRLLKYIWGMLYQQIKGDYNEYE